MSQGVRTFAPAEMERIVEDTKRGVGQIVCSTTANLYHQGVQAGEDGAVDAAMNGKFDFVPMHGIGNGQFECFRLASSNPHLQAQLPPFLLVMCPKGRMAEIARAAIADRQGVVEGLRLVAKDGTVVGQTEMRMV